MITRGGPDKDLKTLQLHVNILADKPPVLRRLALTSQSPDIKLLDCDSEAFTVFSHLA